MKKLVFILITILAMTGCSVDDDSGPRVEYELAEIVANDLPDEFEFGKTYEVTVTYILPSACHSFAGLDARREGNVGEERRIIYVSAIAAIQLDSNCDDTVGGDQGTSKFTINIDEEEDYTFNFLVGEAGNEPVYNTVVIPVTQPQS
ncbi:hypothetical protein NE848_09390 [Gramella jeungdoensis]|uniref:Lipoprotein n=1 Tax=Gramella jeungdoensis TaxID=708091 RepID=A0ABT0Z2G8_9FLAO|nr:hypothetical protein [Gramella jeungdoensis]MCM8569593.1 hypothetical protein [Gramella jeungdoensis]